jgi:2-polyprenyl-3-methyl-5-hydroxy-6-metoxy-1,4-benzoquinol methylase
VNCPICGGKTRKKHSGLWDDRYGYPGRFDLLKCQDCGHAFLNCAFTPEQITALYTNYYPRRTYDIEEFKPRTKKSGLAAWLNGLDSAAFRWVPKNVRVLDVGCGFGQSLAYHTARGCDVYGVEADENIRRVAEKFSYKVHVGLFDPGIYDDAFFDYVTMDQVVEHVTDPLATLQGIARILKPGGTAIFSTPNGHGWGARLFARRWINWHTPYHLQFFSKKSMQLTAEQVGFSIETRTVTNSEWLLYQWLHLITYPDMGTPSSFWAPNGRSTRMKKLFCKIVLLIHKTKVNHLITRLFDGLDLGDNFVFILKKT